MDALQVDQFFVAGHDWGSNIAEALAACWPARVTRIAMLSTPSRLGGLQTPPVNIARLYWYHWFQATKRGAEAVAKNPKDFARIMWDTWSPPGGGDVAFDPRSSKIEAKIKATRRLKTPTLFFHGALDGVTPPEMMEKMSEKFSGRFERIVFEGVGHFPTREAPELVGKKLVAHFSPRS
jgi:pimeloyl-ACP methyl ester carboxylesterase